MVERSHQEKGAYMTGPGTYTGCSTNSHIDTISSSEWIYNKDLHKMEEKSRTGYK